MPRNRDPTQINSIAYLEVLYLTVLSFGLFFKETTFKNLLCYVYIIASSFMFLWSPCVYMIMHVSVSCLPVFLVLFLALGFCPILICLELYHLIHFIIISWMPVCFLIRHKKSMGQDGKKGVKELEGVRGEEIRIHCMKKSLWKMP